MAVKPLISIVISAHNEESGLPALYRAITKKFFGSSFRYELIIVDDGSTDQTFKVIKQLARKTKKIRALKLSTNFGHEAAMLAGISIARGKAIVCMDADLQHPPAKVIEMVKLFQAGYEVVTMVRKVSKSWLLKDAFSQLFYKIMNLISDKRFEPGATDFFLISKTVAQVIKKDYQEKNRFIRGIIQIVGFKSTHLTFDAPERTTGQSKYSLYRLFALSLIAFSSFSRAPLHFCLFLGIGMSLFSFVLAGYSIIIKLIGSVVPGYTTIVVFMSFMFSIQFLILGILSEYLGFLLIENKNRPIYTIESRINA